MGLRLKHLGVGLAALLTAGCPQGERVLGNGGFGIGSGGSPATDRLSFTIQPSDAVAGQVISAGAGVQVTVLDSLGNTDPNFTSPVNMAIASNPVGGNLSGTTSVTPVNGIARFADLSIDKAGTGYTLRASVSASPGATAATSSSFTITSQ
jgi:hypothetical protein